MALIECQACKATVSKNAVSCPHCGEPQKNAASGVLWGVAAGLLVILMLLLALVLVLARFL